MEVITAMKPYDQRILSRRSYEGIRHLRNHGGGGVGADDVGDGFVSDHDVYEGDASDGAMFVSKGSEVLFRNLDYRLF